MSRRIDLAAALLALAGPLRLRHVAGPDPGQLDTAAGGATVTDIVGPCTARAGQPVQVASGRALPASFGPRLRLLVLCDDAPAPPALPPAATVCRTPRATGEVLDAFGLALAPRLAEPVVQHGVLVRMHGCGILVTGAAGAGKGMLALGLIDRGAALVADDAVETYRIGRERVGGVCPEMLRGFLEVRPLGLLDIAGQYGPDRVAPACPLDLRVELDAGAWPPATPGDRLAGPLAVEPLLEVPLPVLRLGPGAGAPLLVAAAARQLQLDRVGEPPADALRRRHRRYMRGGRG
ncbi:MAG TPA: hypothetical protein VFA95_14760 [Gammaproteobacteria bacterium]|nr:hypothetical protein [Gammaproteobacteria bacterium]